MYLGTCMYSDVPVHVPVFCSSSWASVLEGAGRQCQSSESHLGRDARVKASATLATRRRRLATLGDTRRHSATLGDTRRHSATLATFDRF